ncbi:squalene/phytoene synthase family protein [Mumia sp. zg.B17]|uniref:phytoene/squalene synthase family protein n=1 Tax=unclassified Mumia TaxID=2621872 RepID=UPI001C6E59C9|nr:MULTISPECIES: squalene/phytoene synthase family protein [unclassified Mumia]MBW9205839.1 squalene/phytoene synthase family protein [Mumia sp. zg.B17]MDD9348227.1 squalene/phytoene synthase family protein [Mumia sp.]
MTALVSGSPSGVSASDLYDSVADESAALVIRRYSTSFALATRLLGDRVRTDVKNVYALVRIADEVVDAPRSGARAEERRALLDALEAETEVALERGHSANLVVHAFARTAHRCGIGLDVVTPFFSSMRVDLEPVTHDPESFATYVYGSAEVVGLMCLRAFLRGVPDGQAAYDGLSPGARRLGAAFQKINFLRDLAADHHDLGRSYFPGLDPSSLSDGERDAILDDIDDDFRVAAAAIAGLPADCRRAVDVARALFGELAVRLRSTPAVQIREQRVRLSAPVKARVVAGALARSGR